MCAFEDNARLLFLFSLVLGSIFPALTLSGSHLILAFIKTTELVSVHQHGPEL